MSLSALDYEGVRFVLARYCHALDLGDIDGAVACFTNDGSFESFGPPDVSAHPGKRLGAAALRKGFEMGIAARGTHSRHWVVNSVIESDGDSARATSYCLLTRDHGVPPGTMAPSAGVLLSGIYFDRLVKVGEVWLIAERRFRADPQPE